MYEMYLFICVNIFQKSNKSDKRRPWKIFTSIICEFQPEQMYLFIPNLFVWFLLLHFFSWNNRMFLFISAEQMYLFIRLSNARRKAHRIFIAKNILRRIYCKAYFLRSWLQTYRLDFFNFTFICLWHNFVYGDLQKVKYHLYLESSP